VSVASLKGKLYTRLTSGGLTALVGARVYPMMSAPQSSPQPYIVYEIFGTDTGYDLASKPYDVRYTIRLHIIADTALEVAQLCDAIRTRMLQWTDKATKPNINSAQLDNERDDTNAIRPGTDEPVHYATQDWIVWVTP